MFIDLSIGGSYDAITILLLHQLPNINTLTFVIDIGAEDYVSLNQIMRLIAAGYQDPTIAPKLPLHKLKTAATICANTRGCNYVDWACNFSYIPSLRAFTTWAMGSEDVSFNGEDHLRIVSAPVSNVEELLFSRCQFDTASLDTLLPHIKNLRKFTYAAGVATVAYSYFELRKLIKALAKYAGHSLEQLVLEEEYAGYRDDEDHDPWVSLQGFQVLRSFNCELRCLVGSQGADSVIDDALSHGFHSRDCAQTLVTDPRDCLPPSLENFYLHGVFEHEEWEQLRQIFETSNPATPKLQSDGIYIQDLSRFRNNQNGPNRIGTTEEPLDVYSHPLSRILDFE
ncbi:hypothetical protein NX059_009144 [Plenodomus lindquistii]|nr:hypothetical protein NX059_009144 [Plenodomus lindquistii]